MSKFVEVRHLRPMELRKLCIEYNWYTHGDNAEYDNLLFGLTENGQKNITTDDIYAIAQDIMDHSSERSIDGMDIESIMFSVARICDTFFQKGE